MKIALIGSRNSCEVWRIRNIYRTFGQRPGKHGYTVSVVVEKNHPGAEFIPSGIKRVASTYKKAFILFGITGIHCATIGKNDLVFRLRSRRCTFYPIYRSAKTKIITNVDGLEHLRTKFSKVKKAMFGSRNDLPDNTVSTWLQMEEEWRNIGNQRCMFRKIKFR